MGRFLLVVRLALRDLRRRRAEAVLLLLAFTAAMATLTLGMVLNGVTDQPYQQTRAATHGPDVIAVYYPPASGGSAADLSSLTKLTQDSDVNAHSGPFPMTWVNLQASGHSAAAVVQGRETTLAPVDQPSVTQGSWMGGPGTAVVERSFADALGIKAGDAISLSGRSFRVSGIAVTAAIPPYPQVCTNSACELNSTRKQGQETGLIWVNQADATSLATPAQPLYYFLNLKISDPDNALAFGVRNQPPSPAADQTGPFINGWQSLSWQDGKIVLMVKQDLLIGSWLLGLLAIASVAVLVGGRMADQIRRVGLLKAVGGSPALVAAVLLAEYVLLALLSAAAGLLIGWRAAPLLTDPGSGLVGTAVAPSITVSTAVAVVASAVAVAVVATFVPALRAARTSTVRALSDSARPPKRHGLLIAISSRLPVTLLIGLRLTARRPRRTLLSVASVAVTTSGLVAVLTSRAHMKSQGAGLDNPQDDRLGQVLLTLTVMMVALAAVNAIFITWATVLDARHASALTRALGATPQQVSAGLSAAQILPALLGALLGVPGGIGLIAGAQHGGTMTYPPAWQLAVAVVATAPFIALLTAVPARLGARRPVAVILQSE
ncbi:MAG: transporter permease [Pseudonocardia sp.]|nr:transporter permease [Pseudonocardia sp.]